MRTFLILTLLAMISGSHILPTVAQWEEDPEQTPGFFEGDIVLRPKSRNCMSNPTQYWPDGIVYYKFWEGFDDVRKDFIRKAMNIVEEGSCIRFKEADEDQPYFVNITGNPGGCYSTVGFVEDISVLNLQKHALNTGCYRTGKIIHELLHALGFYHMQSTYDRDDYIRIAYENVEPNFVHDFTKYSKDFVEDFGEKYDYGSIMHYSPHAFSANGAKTIVPLQEIPEGLMGQREALSTADLIKLNKMYKCPEMQVKE
ncbi:seminal metalloprotease 1-like [Bactrocera neohumeralis]|uniref:seminal metalloprotease 1-like n=1 Tax=Bactrocera neohumeralis TaxID=98809 RepID=UPI002165A62C|nr:seminal metalloprotease 1-like [Bactrocera neohumeralis]